VWAQSRDLLDLGPLHDAIHAETAAADFYHFTRDLETCQSFCMTYRFPITSSWTACRHRA
jgi:hypothetical protein